MIQRPMPHSPVGPTQELSHAARRLANAGLLNELLEGDCLEQLDAVPDSSVDMVLCDLPFGTTQNEWDSEIDLPSLWEQYLRVVKEDGAIVLNSQGIFTARLILSNPDHFEYKLVWEKSKPTNFLNARKQPLRKHEDICVFYRRQCTYNPQMTEGTPYNKGVRKNQLTGSYGAFSPSLVKSNGERFPTDIVYHKTAESEGEVWHPTQKPVGLARYLIRTYSRPGDIILDNAFGSGSYLVAALQEGRNFLGIELNDGALRFRNQTIDLFDIARQRLVQAYSTLSSDTRSYVFQTEWLANPDQDVVNL